MAQKASLGTRLGRGWSIAMTSWNFILENKKILFFSACTIILNFTVFMAFFHYLLKDILVNKNITIVSLLTPRIFIISIFTIFIFQALLNNIMHGALCIYTANIFEKKPASFFDSLFNSIKHIFTLLLWTAINLVIGVIVTSLKGGRNNSNNILQNLLGGIISLAWKVLTFFVLPIIVLKGLGIYEAIKESAYTMKNTWGENLGATFNIEIISMIAYAFLSTITFLVVSVWTNIDFISLLMRKQILQLPPEQIYPVIFWITIIAIAPTVILSPFFSAARTIFKTAVYQYTQKKPTGPFTQDFIKTSFEIVPGTNLKV